MRFLEMERLSKLLTICLQVTFGIGLLVTLFLSILLRRYFGWYFWGNPVYYWACVVLLTPCGLCCLNILWQLIVLLKTIHVKDPFVPKNVTGLKRIAYSAFIISAMFFMLLCVQATMLTFAIGYIFLIAGFLFIVMAQLFQKAVAFKSENDLTI